ncbi:hypothetical protein Zmor_018174 [Zophobas morio]|uniref:Uncharacterized protein n=1 Tax=Zophobas morio TaxID=2755281 RepID=A0AA38IA13_9CUCU|nr:hypothetical protein Zmor_018174 [Zophobas morio]
MKTLKVIILLFVIVSFLCVNEAKKRRRKNLKGMILRQKETNAIDFLRLTVMRVIFGLANRFGFGEQISEALNGAFVPPGVDDDYDDGFSLFDRDDDYDY